ncbi:hypothetical protein HDE_13821 [Halotydeus destructor]|nr:hypothetical protein HDE_13821 [Halotydeus destructor]
MLSTLESEVVTKTSSAMDDGGRCVLVDVLSDPELLQSFLEDDTASQNGQPNGTNHVQASSELQSIDGLRELRLPVKYNQEADLNTPSSNSAFSSDSKQVELVTSSVHLSPRTISEQSIRSKPVEEKPSLSTVFQPSLIKTPITGTSSKISVALTSSAMLVPRTSTITVSASAPRVSVANQPLTLRQALNGPIQLATPRSNAVTVQPQHLVQVSNGAFQQMVQTVGGQVILTRPPVANVQQNQQLSQSTLQTPSGQLVQIIQTPSGPAAQIVPTPPVTPNVEPNSMTGKSPSLSASSRAANKQILPKPSTSPGVSSRPSTPAKQTAAQRAAATKNVQSNTAPVAMAAPQMTSTLPVTSTASPQFMIGGQPASLIQGPNGTLLLNPMSLQQMNGGQQLLFQGGLGQGMQLTLRPPGAQLVTVSGSGPTMNTSAPLVTALSQPSASQTIHRTINPNQQQAFVISSQNHGLTNNVQNGFINRGQNIFFTRPPNMLGQHFMQSQAPAPQIIQIQTPNGPMLVALQATPQPQQVFANQQHSVMNSAPMLQQTFQANTMQQPSPQSLHTLLAQNNHQNSITTSNANIMFNSNTLFTSNPTFSQMPVTSTPSVSQNKSVSKGVNLADLLKESGILPDSSPPTSPVGGNQQHTRTSENDSVTLPQERPQPTILQPHPKPAILMMSSMSDTQPGMLIPQQQNISTPQLRLALAPDGSITLQPNITLTPNVQISNQSEQYQNISALAQNAVPDIKDTSGSNFSQPSPDSTTPTIDAATPTVVTTTAVTPLVPVTSKSSLVERLSNSPTIKSERTSPVIRTEEKPALIPLSVQGISLQERLLSGKTKISGAEVKATNLMNSSAALPKGCDTYQITSLPLVISATSASSMTFSHPVQSSATTLSSVNGLTTVRVNHLANKADGKFSSETKSHLPEQNVNRILLTTALPTAPSMTTKQETSKSTTPNTQLVSILKSSNGTPQQIKLVAQPLQGTPPAGSTTIQVGNQFFTISAKPQQPLQNSLPADTVQLKPQVPATTPVFQVVRLQQPQVVPTPKASPSSHPVKPSRKEIDPAKKREAITKFIQQQLQADQQAALKPDTSTPFKSRADACKRLLRYHVFNSPLPSYSKLKTVDDEFELVSKNLLVKKQQLFDKYRHTFLKLSTKETPTAETILLNKLFVTDETESLKMDKEVVSQGIPLDLPPLPENWLNSTPIQQNLDDFMTPKKELMNRKRKSDTLEDYSSQSPQVPKHEEELATASISQMEESGSSEDEEDDSEDDDGDFSKLLENANVLSDMSGLYGGANYSHQMNVSSNSMSCISNNHDTNRDLFHGLDYNWRTHTNYGHPSYSDTGWSKRYGNESDVAADSILNHDEAQMSADLSAIANNLEGLGGVLHQDEDEDDDDDEEDEDDDDEDSSQASLGGSCSTMRHQPQPHIDVQMQSAIDSILDIPQQGSHDSFRADSAYAYAGRGYNHLGQHVHGTPSGSRHNGMQSSYMNSQSSLNDPLLDEAVKSILS